MIWVVGTWDLQMLFQTEKLGVPGDAVGESGFIDFDLD